MNCRNSISFYFLLIALLTPLAFYSQSALAPFILSGKVTLNDKAAEGVTLELTKGGKKITKIVTPKNGKYSMELKQSTSDKQNEYILTISKPGTVTKNLSINTYVPKNAYEDEPYDYGLDISLIETELKDVVLQKPTGKIKWNSADNAFDFDQAYAKIIQKEMPLDDPKKLAAYIKKKKNEEDKIKQGKAKVVADSIAAYEKDKAEKARLEAEAARAKFVADSTADADKRIEAERILQQSLDAKAKEILKKRIADSLAAFNANKGEPIPIPVKVAEDEPTEFDGNHAFSLNIEKNRMKAAKDKSEKKKAANLATKYETSNVLTSLLDVVDSYEKQLKK